jgi:hypothetical protein
LRSIPYPTKTELLIIAIYSAVQKVDLDEQLSLIRRVVEAALPKPQPQPVKE